MKATMRTMLVALLFIFYGCVGPLVPVVKIDSDSARQLRENIKIYNRAEIPEGSYTRLGTLQSTSCMNKIWDISSKEDAVNQLLYKSSLLGGNGVTDLVCGEEGTSLSKNCWKSFTCYGAAIKIGHVQSVSKKDNSVVTSGTGFVISKDGHILTNSHVVSGAEIVTVYVGGQSINAIIIRNDSRNDLAILKIDKKTIPVIFRSDNKIRAGEPIIAIGFPLANILAKEPHVTTGSINALAGIKDDIRFIQISAPIQPGNSGGPILDETGRVIGIAVSKLDALKAAIITGDIPQNVNFAIRLSLIKSFIEAADISINSSNNIDKMNVADISEKVKGSVVYIESR